MRSFIVLFTLGLVLIGLAGYILHRNSVVRLLITIEVLLLAVSLQLVLASLALDDILGQVRAIIILAVAGAESAIGLAIIVALSRL